MRTRIIGSAIALSVFVVLGVFVFLKDEQKRETEVPEVTFEQIQDESQADEISRNIEEDTQEAHFDFPDESVPTDAREDNQMDELEHTNLAVPFTPQAPHGNWELPYQEACEEASAYMVWLYFKGESSGLVNADRADADLLALVEHQREILGHYEDTTAQETATFIESFYGLRARVVENPTEEQIKAQITAGYPVILPASGRELRNPFFSGEGPLYHMIVLRGFDNNGFITNDPGTRRGEGYVYSFETIMNAMGDWNNGDPANGSKRVIFVQP